MTQIIDRRFTDKNRSAVNRQRFIQRVKQQLKQAVTDAVSRRRITEIDQGEQVIIPAKDLSEPHFHFGNSGHREVVHPHNREFIAGDRIKKPLTGSGKEQGSGASQNGEGEDKFVFQLSREEFLNLFFDDLALPDMIKKTLVQLPTYTPVRAGFTRFGTPSRLNIARSMRQATARRIAIGNPYRKQLILAEEKLQQLLKQVPDEHPEAVALHKEIIQLKAKIKRIPFLDTFDLRFNNFIAQPKLTTQAVMFCLMDVSGSMDENRKELAKRFFMLLYLFLMRNYQKIELVFIRHHTKAKEVDEQEFFYSRETGGTVVSSALNLMAEIMRARYPTQAWNIYGAQASDGDNWQSDSPQCAEILQQQIMPFVQYFAYVEVMPQEHQSLWEAYLTVQQYYKNFAMQSVNDTAEIYPVFRELFKRQQEKVP